MVDPVRGRGHVKGKLTRLSKFIDNIDPQNISDQTRYEIESRLDVMSSIWSSFEGYQSAIETSAADEIVESQERDDFESRYFSLLSRMKLLLRDSQPISISTPAINSSSNSSQQINIPLPQLSIPTFDGTLIKWQSFKDSFNALITDNRQLNNIQRFHYLKSALKFDAASVIQSIQVTEDNYAVAWELLNSRFENKQVTIDHHIRSLMEITTINKESLFSLRSLYDTATQHVRALHSICEDSKHWDLLIIYILANKLDVTTRCAWEQYRQSLKTSRLSDLEHFILQRCSLLEAVKPEIATVKAEFKTASRTKIKCAAATTSLKAAISACHLCKGKHFLYQCNTFRNLSVHARTEEVRKKSLCYNCLRPGHSINECKFSNCRICNSKHNSLLHTEPSPSAGPSPVAVKAEPTTPNSSLSLHFTNNKLSPVLLSTALIFIADSHGRQHCCRALLDSGSQSSLISKTLVDKLCLETNNICVSLVGVNKSVSVINSAVDVQISSTNNNFTFSHSCLVLPEVTSRLPRVDLCRSSLNIPPNIRLADPEFDQGGNVDVLLGADVFWDLIGYGHVNGDKNRPSLHETCLGWIISGRLPKNNIPRRVSSHLVRVNNEELDKQLTRFWCIEEPENVNIRSPDEEYCENHFLDTYRRDDSGRFVVQIPFRDNVNQLGNSYDFALKRFMSLERKFSRDPSLRSEYVQFMRDYETLGHMHLIEPTLHYQSDGYFIPHHAVFKDDRGTRKIRVVFDASAKSRSGLSLNDVQFSGGALQNDIFQILTRFRTYRYAFSADIIKMYRQVNIEPKQHKYQRILWRYNPNEPIGIYELVTATYGTSSAPFLAMRSLRQLTREGNVKLPIAKLINENFYVDDILAGADSVESALEHKNELSILLASGRFVLDKWRANFEINPPNSDHEKSIFVDDSKILGIMWNSDTDCLHYSFQPPPLKTIPTKRCVASLIARLYDPLGILSPVIIKAKCILQRLWESRVHWDDPIPGDLRDEWEEYCIQLRDVTSIYVPRFALFSEAVSVQLHGFSDASASAFGACVYLRTTNTNSQVNVSLLCAKSKVTPLQVTSLPRLELCAAVLLAKLVNHTINSTDLCFDGIYLWSDSTVTLAWISGTPTKWKTFVANRVSTIQRLTASANWRHVVSKENPADIVSRGCNARDLVKNPLWLSGPSWLQFPIEDWPRSDCDVNNVTSEMLTLKLTIQDRPPLFVWSRFSNLNRLKRTFAFVLRFITNSRQKTKHLRGNNSTVHLSLPEIDKAFLSILNLAQRECFANEFKTLNVGNNVSMSSSLISLHPFIDTDGLLRVGGRLANSYFGYDKKHPIVLPPKHPLTKLIVQNEHRRLLHAGPQHMLSSLRDRFWPIAGRDLCRRVARSCVTCFRAHPRNSPPLMGSLPAQRVSVSSPFLHTGVDYAGPFLIRDRKNRGCRLIKSYLCLFVCQATKAVHLELVGELTTDGFICAFQRFVARRGRPSTMRSDNGLNFVGAERELRTIVQSLVNEKNTITNNEVSEGILWSFIPPRAPHFGGLWESSIKSVKFHLRRVLGEQHLTYEEFSTLLVQIEGILNSRPLCPMSPDPSDLISLTPAHFLIGRPITAVPSYDVTNLNIHRLNRYQMLQQMYQHFWRRWSREYASLLQIRTKWKQPTADRCRVGRLVLVQEDNSPPLRWPLGRIIDVHPGKDGTCRVATVRTGSIVVTRAVTKLFPLPMEEEEDVLPRTESLQREGHVGAQDDAPFEASVTNADARAHRPQPNIIDVL